MQALFPKYGKKLPNIRRYMPFIGKFLWLAWMLDMKNRPDCETGTAFVIVVALA